MFRMKTSLLSVFTLCMISAHAANFDIVNRCSYTVWPGTFLTSSGPDGFQLNSGQTRNLNISAGTVGRIWGRTGCKFDRPFSGRRGCETGDCGGTLKCTLLGKPPNTLAEFSLSDENDVDYFNLSVRDGFNIAIQFASTSNGCNKERTCRDSACPDAYRVLRGMDTSKTVSCPEGTNYKIIFCP